MKRSIIIFTTLLLILLSVSCDNLNQGNTYVNDTFDGKCWTFEVDPFNTTREKSLLCQKGDILEVSIDITSGFWEMEIYKSGEEPIYKDSNSGKIKKSAAVECPSEGTYFISITGEKVHGKFVISRNN